jgi:hypothetical protein
VPGKRTLTSLLYGTEFAGLIQRKADDAGDVAPDAELAVAKTSSSTGDPLPDRLLRLFGSSLGVDLSGVRVHTGPESAAAAAAVGAKAYTVGQDIHFAAGAYDPGSNAGQQLLAHEVAHTVQQRGQAPRRQAKLEVSMPGDVAEHAADAAAAAMVAGRPADAGTCGSRGVVHRTADDAPAPEAAPASEPAGSEADGDDVEAAVRQALAGLEGSSDEGSCNVLTETIASKIFVASGGKVKPDRVYNGRHYVLRVGDTIIDPTAAQFVNYPPGVPAPILVGSEAEVRAQFAKLVDDHKIRHASRKQADSPHVPSTITSSGALADFAYGGGTVRQHGDALVARPSGKKADYDTARNEEIKAQKQAEAALASAARPAAARAGGGGAVSVHPIIDVGGPAPGGDAVAVHPIVEVTAGQAAKVDATGVATQPATDADPVAAAKQLRPQLATKAQAARAAFRGLADEHAGIDAAIAAAPADQKPALQARKQELATKLVTAERQLGQLDADLQALDDPRSTRDTYHQILARQKSGVTVAASVEVDDHDGALDHQRANHRQTTTTTAYDGAAAHQQTDATSTKIGADGYSQTHSRTKHKVTADQTTRDSERRTSRVGLDGLSYDQATDHSEERDGKTSGSGSATQVKLGPGGASRTDTTTRTNQDGSSESHERASGLERGDGRVGAVRSSTDVTKSADGGEVKDATKAKGGMVAGKDGYGGFAEAERTYDKKNANGTKTGVVAGLDANVVCNIAPVPDSDPAKYRVALSVNLGAKVGASAGHDKDGATGSASVAVTGSGTVMLSRSYVLTDDEAQAYVAALKAASGGSGGDKQEMAIIAAGVRRGWPAAQALYLQAANGAADPAAVNELKEGEALKVDKSSKVGGEASLGGKGASGSLGVSGGYEVGSTSSMEVTRKDGKLVYNASEGDSDKLSGGATVGVGPAVSGGMGASHTNTSSTSYEIVVDPKDPSETEMREALARCKSQADLDAFALKYPKAVKEKTKQTGSIDEQTGSIGVLGVKGGINFHQSLDEKVTTDGDGNFKHKTVTGGNGGGVELGVGDYKIGASSKDQAVADIDADGNAAVDVSHATTETNTAKWLGAHVPFAGDKQDDQGTLAKVAGDKPAQDTDDRDVSGMKLKGSDLSGLGYLAVHDWGKWMSACPSPRMRDDWAAAGRKIARAGGEPAVVAEALAKFVSEGGSSDVVYAAVRSPGDVRGGARYEFPGALVQQKSRYDAIVVADSELGLDALAQSDGKDKAITKGTDLVAQLDSLFAVVRSASGFTQPAVQAEMLAAITGRRDKVKAALRVLNGGKADVLSRADLLDKYNALVTNCVDHQQSETACFAKIEATYQDGSKPSLDEAVENAKLIKQLRDMYAVWNTEYNDMAALAQEHGFGKDNYWKLKPDKARFQRALSGPPGPASEPKPETEDKRKKQPVTEAPRDPVGDANREHDKVRSAQGDSIQGRIGPAKNQAYGAGNRLFAWIQTHHKPAAIDAHNRGMVILHRADDHAAKLSKQPKIEELETTGFFAVQDYGSAERTFGEGLALSPGGSPPKPKG